MKLNKSLLRKVFSRSFVLYPLILVLALMSVYVYAAPKDRKPPTAPSGLHAVTITDTSVTLAWDPSKDNTGVKQYIVYKGTLVAGKTSLTNYTVSELMPSTSYTFTVKASDAAGNISLSSNAISVTTQSAPVTTAPAEPAGKKIIGYYAGWATYSGNQVSELDGSKLTHINYAFANIGSDLKIALGDPYADVEQVFPDDSATDPYHGNFNQLRKLKQRYPHLKTYIAIGGWSWSGKFSDVALTDASRSDFADSVVQFVVKYGFDGVDIDWEYPVSGGMPDNIRKPEDKQNFTYLMQELRKKLDAQGAKDGKQYLLSFAGSAGSYYVNNIELSKLQQVVDNVNIMAYDLHGNWDPQTGLNAPLYKDPNGLAAQTSVHDAVQLYLNQGVPKDKLVMGVPFYGYKYDNVPNVNNGLYQTFNGGKAATYSEIASRYIGQGYTRYFHKDSKVPYLYNGSSFISYDDPESIGYKAQYIKDQGISGAMVWELSQDNANHDLLTSLYQGLQ